MARVLVPLPDRDFDVTEVAVPWKLLRRAGHEVVFATEGGAQPAADPRLLTGVLFGQLGAESEPRAFYADLTEEAAFKAPERWREIDVSRFDGLVLPGGHAPGMRQYLGSEDLQRAVQRFWDLGRPVGAICRAHLDAQRLACRAIPAPRSITVASVSATSSTTRSS